MHLTRICICLFHNGRVFVFAYAFKQFVISRFKMKIYKSELMADINNEHNDFVFQPFLDATTYRIKRIENDSNVLFELWKCMRAWRASKGNLQLTCE